MKIKRYIFKCLTVAMLLFTASSAFAQAIYTDVPEKVDTKGYYLFYLHGRIIEIKGIRPTSEKYGVYEYEKILEALKNKGFYVISEVRTGNVNIGQFAKRVAFQVDELMKKGVPASHITVIGASKGAVMAMQVSTILMNKDLRFVFLASCGDIAFYKYDIDYYGYILSIYDEKDELVGSCNRFAAKSNGLSDYDEIKLKVGTGHGILYKPLKEWIDPAVRWARTARID